jgi:hypothetical protein
MNSSAVNYAGRRIVRQSDNYKVASMAENHAMYRAGAGATNKERRMIFTKYKNIIYSGLITALISLILIPFLFAFRSCHHVDFKNYKDYTWLFEESIIKNIDSVFFVRCIRKSDNLYMYNLRNVKTNDTIHQDYQVLIWEIKPLQELDLHESRFNENVNLSECIVFPGEVLNSKSTPQIKVKFKLNFNNTLNIDLNENSKIKKNIESTDYKGFYGEINKLSLSNNEGENIIVIDNGIENIYSLFLLYKHHGRFFLIDLTSDKEFSETRIDLLNLKN